jgi:stringent starvation protein B
MSSMTSTKPYLFRAILDWIEDNGLTPHVVVDALVNKVSVPLEYVSDGQITLNISSASIEIYQLDNEYLHFSARFNGVSQEIYIPIVAIMGVYARENGQGMFFEAEEVEELEVNVEEKLNDTDSLFIAGKKAEKKMDKAKPSNKVKKKDDNKKASKRDNSHLKIIK